MTTLAAIVLEAWEELRIHRVRVLLSLIGVAFAVTAITSVAAVMQILQALSQESNEKSSGRSITLTYEAYSESTLTDAQVQQTDQALTEFWDRYNITYHSRSVWLSQTIDFGSNVQTMSMTAVDPDYATIYRTVLQQGQWFSETDEQLLAPQLVVNQAFLTNMGITDLSAHPTVQIGTETPTTATIIGVYVEPWENTEPYAYIDFDQAQQWGLVEYSQGNISAVAWVPPNSVTELSNRLQAETAGIEGINSSVYDNSEALSYNMFNDRLTRWVTLGIGGFALFLGGLGLVNISLTTVRYRIREIGIRRAIGAGTGRVFFGVMMESVVGTTLSGFIGVLASIILVKNLPIEEILGMALSEPPPFPIGAALIGMAISIGIGALAGLLPALVAVRVKVIDAIRF